MEKLPFYLGHHNDYLPISQRIYLAIIIFLYFLIMRLNELSMFHHKEKKK
jgi:hypothetical protein